MISKETLGKLTALQLQKYALGEACSCQSQSLVNLAKLQSYGLTEDRLLQLNNFLANNGYNIDLISRS